MTNWILRAVLLLWGALFGLIGVQQLVAAAPYFDMFGITGGETAINTVRADLSAFFMVAAAGALTGAVRPGASRALLVPAALFGAAFVGRGIGLAVGDPLTAGITQAMIAEALSTLLMLGAMWKFSRPDPELLAAPEAPAAGADQNG